MGRNKQISCEICFKVMRFDNVKRHMKMHVDLSLKGPEQLCKSILEDIHGSFCQGASGAAAPLIGIVLD